MRSILIAIVFLLIASCNKNNDRAPDTLPPITQTGANTFGCKINGKVWIPYYPCSAEFINCSELQFGIYTYPADTLDPLSFAFGGGRYEGSYEADLGIACLEDSDYSITQKHATVSHIGNFWDSVSVTYLDSSGFYFSSGYRSGYSSAGSNLTITKFDTLNRIISGTFSFTLYAGNDSIVITDGRFDFKIAPLCKCSQ